MMAEVVLLKGDLSQGRQRSLFETSIKTYLVSRISTQQTLRKSIKRINYEPGDVAMKPLISNVDRLKIQEDFIIFLFQDKTRKQE